MASGQLSGYQIQVLAHEGIVDLLGDVANESQRAAAIQIAREVPGITARDGMMRGLLAVVQTQAPVILVNRCRLRLMTAECCYPSSRLIFGKRRVSAAD